MQPTELLRRAGVALVSPTRLSGGDMGDVWRCGAWVVKCLPGAAPGHFAAEAAGLAAMRDVGARVPAVRYVDDNGIVIEQLDASPDPVGLAESIAALHRAPAARYGWPGPVFLGRFPLPAGTGAEWREHWITRRIEPLLRAAWPALGPVGAEVEAALLRFEPPVEGAVLTHGDLWSGNVVGSALIDPAAQWAERGIDLAMMHLFGGFDQRFWDAYHALAPVPQAVLDAVPYHQLHYLLAHVLFFGGGYVSATSRAARACR